MTNTTDSTGTLVMRAYMMSTKEHGRLPTAMEWPDGQSCTSQFDISKYKVKQLVKAAGAAGFVP